MENNKHHKHTLTIVQLALLIAVMLMLELTGLGMLRFGPLEMTILQFPVIVGAILMGPAAGAGLGLVFGLISFWECFGKSAFGASLLSINPFYTFLVCVPTRTLMGFFCGLIYKLTHKCFVSKKDNPSQGRKLVPYITASLSGALLNTLFFMSTLLALFSTTEYIQGFISLSGTANLLMFAFWFVGTQGIVEAVLCAFLGAVISRAVNAILKK